MSFYYCGAGWPGHLYSRCTSFLVVNVVAPDGQVALESRSTPDGQVVSPLLFRFRCTNATGALLCCYLLTYSPIELYLSPHDVGSVIVVVVVVAGYLLYNVGVMATTLRDATDIAIINRISYKEIMS